LQRNSAWQRLLRAERPLVDLYLSGSTNFGGRCRVVIGRHISVLKVDLPRLPLQLDFFTILLCVELDPCCGELLLWRLDYLVYHLGRIIGVMA